MNETLASVSTPVLDSPLQMQKAEVLPRHMLLQWHITERCNLRCTHCYQENAGKTVELDFEKLCTIFHQFLELLDGCQRQHVHKKTTAHINVTGGEPFLRDDFIDLLDLFSAHRNRFSYAILTNGTRLDDRLARYLSLHKPKFVQLSLDGTQETHDRMRGSGNFDRVCGGVRLLKRYKIPVMISFTATRYNFREFPKVAKIVCALGVEKLWTDRFIPMGQCGTSNAMVLSPEETQEFVKIVSQESKRSKGSWPWNLIGPRTKVAAHRALQFLGNGNENEGRAYSCSAGSTLITVQANGDLVPCRRMPIVVGNLLQDSMSNLYKNSLLMNQLRRTVTIAGCETCAYLERCKGGLRCLSYSIHADPFRADPGCWLAK